MCGATLQKFMSNPLVQAFFVGRAIAEVINERVEVALTDALSELGKFDAEAKEQPQITHLGEIHQTYRPKLTN